MAFKHLKLLRGSSVCLTTKERDIINSIVRGLKQRRNYTLAVTKVYEFVWKDIKPSINTDKIKYCLLLLHIKGMVSIINRKKNLKTRITGWKTFVRLKRGKPLS